MRNLVTGLILTAAVAAPLAAVAPADAANARCMSNTEYSRIHAGMTQTRVKQIVGSLGRITFEWNDSQYPELNEKDREWHRCGMSSWHTAEIDFEGAGYRVTRKSRY